MLVSKDFMSSLAITWAAKWKTKYCFSSVIIAISSKVSILKRVFMFKAWSWVWCGNRSDWCKEIFLQFKFRFCFLLQAQSRKSKLQIENIAKLCNVSKCYHSILSTSNETRPLGKKNLFQPERNTIWIAVRSHQTYFASNGTAWPSKVTQPNLPDRITYCCQRYRRKERRENVNLQTEEEYDISWKTMGYQVSYPFFECSKSHFSTTKFFPFRSS